MARLDDGFSTKIEFDEPSDTTIVGILLWEKTVTPPGWDGGALIETSTMRNTAYRTMSPRKLKTLTPGQFTFAYDPAIYTPGNIENLINSNRLITITLSDGAKITFWGATTAISFNACEEGAQPTATATVSPTNQNADGVETALTFTAAP